MVYEKKMRIYKCEMTVEFGILGNGDKEATKKTAEEMYKLLQCACFVLTAQQPFGKCAGWVAVDGETCKINGFTDVAESTGRGKVELIKAKCYKSLLEKPEVLQKLAAACRAVEELKDGA